jgi:hypothetical protein
MDNTTKIETTGVETTTEVTTKTYTQEEVDALLQKESDKRVTEALKKAEKKNQDKVKEAQRLAQMNEQEKYEYQLKQREEAIAAKEKELALAENKNEASKILSEKGLSLTLVDFVVADDADTMKANIDLLDKAFKASVKAEVEKRLGSNSPKRTSVDKDALTKESFRKMSLSEQSELFKNNPELYKQLISH